MKEKHGRVKIYMIELIKFVISVGGAHAKIFEQCSDAEIAEFISEIPEVEIVF